MTDRYEARQIATTEWGVYDNHGQRFIETFSRHFIFASDAMGCADRLNSAYRRVLGDDQCRSA